MQIPRDEIESNLPRKGFVREDTHHRYFYHEHNGKRTGAFTYTSQGSSFKTYGAELIARMKKQLKLDTNRQVADLCLCPMTGSEYANLLAGKGVIDEPER